MLTANRTYYVRTDGSDSNNGFANTSGGAFLTVQKAVDTIAGLDIAGFTVTIQIADGTYNGAVTLKNVLGFASPGNLVIQGNNSTPANVVINNSSGAGFSADSLFVVWDIKDLKITTGGGLGGIWAVNCSVRFGNLDFGACTFAHIFANNGANVTCLSNYTISGNSGIHVCHVNANIAIQGKTVTLTGTPAFATAFAYTDSLSLFAVSGPCIFNGSATGKRYQATLNGIIRTGGQGASYLPGDVAGTTATGGQYV